jgi:O-acetylserine/cysteine efflux transporter
VKPLDIVLATVVAIMWGVGFVLTRVAVEEMSSTLLTLLRFALSALPCIFLAPPKMSRKVLIGIAVLLILQFLAQTYGMAQGVPAGLTAVVVQSQALFTIAFAAVLLAEIPSRGQIAGIAIAACGLLLICFTVGYDFSAFAFAMTMTAPISFALSNLLMRGARDVSMLSLTAWVGLISLPALGAVLFVVDGPAATWQSLTHVSPKVAICVLVLSFGSSTLGYWIWGRLLQTYTPAQVVPFALLIPFIGAGASSLVFGETFGPLRLAGVAIVIAGLATMLLVGRSRRVPEILE